MENYPLKLMHIVLSLNTGGLEKVVINLLKGVDRDTYTPILCCLEEPGTLAPEVEQLGVKIIVLEKKRTGIDYLAVAKLASILRREGVNIIHCHGTAPQFYGALAGRIVRVPRIIYTKHDRIPCNTKSELLMRRFLARMTSKVIAVSDDAREVAVNVEKIPQEKVITIFNGIDTQKYRLNIDIIAKKLEIGVSAYDFVIGIVARLAPEKDHNMLLDAFRIVRERMNQGIKLVIVGGGDLREELENKAKLLSINDDVIFLGERHDIPELLAAFNLFALSSTTEGLSITLLEAMAAELPIVATDVGGNPEIVLNDQTGLIVPAKSPDSMAQSIMKIINNKNMAEKMGEAGREMVCANFSLEAMIQKHDEIWRHASI